MEEAAYTLLLLRPHSPRLATTPALPARGAGVASPGPVVPGGRASLASPGPASPYPAGGASPGPAQP
eukprot:14719379-Alexandrium_andersonii.AAC.1